MKWNRTQTRRLIPLGYGSNDWPEQEEQDEEGWEALRGDVGLGVEDDEDDDADDGGYLHKDLGF